MASLKPLTEKGVSSVQAARRLSGLCAQRLTFSSFNLLYFILAQMSIVFLPFLWPDQVKTGFICLPHIRALSQFFE